MLGGVDGDSSDSDYTDSESDWKWLKVENLKIIKLSFLKIFKLFNLRI